MSVDGYRARFISKANDQATRDMGGMRIDPEPHAFELRRIIASPITVFAVMPPAEAGVQATHEGACCSCERGPRV
jgi:hypothetical protein